MSRLWNAWLPAFPASAVDVEHKADPSVGPCHGPQGSASLSMVFGKTV